MENRGRVKKEITVSVPCYNDSGSLIAFHGQLVDFASSNLDLRLFFLFIDDGSTDNTRAVLDEIKKRTPRCEIVYHRENLGFGPTFREAFTLPKTEYVFFIPADGQFPIKSLRDLASSIQDKDFVLGIRKIRKDNVYRRFNSMLYNRIVSMTAGVEIQDVNSIVLFRNNIVKNVFLKSNSAFVNAELVLEALKGGFRLGQVEIEHAPRRYGTGSGGKVSVIVPTALDFFRYLRRA